VKGPNVKRRLILILSAIALMGGLAVAAQAGNKSGAPTKPAPFDVDAAGNVIIPASVPVAGRDGKGVIGPDGRPVTVDPRPGPLAPPPVGADAAADAPVSPGPPTTIVYGG
jgi:hypothetical protein